VTSQSAVIRQRIWAFFKAVIEASTPIQISMMLHRAAIRAYDEEHIITYLRLLDGYAESADWRDVAVIVRDDPKHLPARAERK
jgi:hypothetical protein